VAGVLALAHAGGRRLRGRACLLCVGGLVLGSCALVALPDLASAQEPEPPACPAGGLDAYSGSDDAASEVRALRNELADSCKALRYVLAALRDEASRGADAGEAILAAPLPVDPGGRGVEVTNPPDLEPVTQASLDARDTSHSDLWGLAGMLTGFGLLVAFYRLLRPEG
jgi:hypothetical protein